MIEHKRHDLGHRAWPGVWFGTVYGLAQFMVLYSLRFGTVYGLVRFMIQLGTVYGLVRCIGWYGTVYGLVQYGLVPFMGLYGQWFGMVYKPLEGLWYPFLLLLKN